MANSSKSPDSETGEILQNEFIGPTAQEGSPKRPMANIRRKRTCQSHGSTSINNPADLKKIFHDARVSLQRVEDRLNSLTESSSPRIPRLTSPGEMDIDPGRRGFKQEIDTKTNVRLEDRTTPMLSSPCPVKGKDDPLSSRCVLHGSGCSVTTPCVHDISTASDFGNEAELVKFLRQTRISTVDAWLDTVLEDDPIIDSTALESPIGEPDGPGPGLGASHHERNPNDRMLDTGSNKENITPSGTSWETISSECGYETTKARYSTPSRRRSFSDLSSRRSFGSAGEAVPMATTPILVRKARPGQPALTPKAQSANRIALDKPSNFFSLPPRRKKMRSSMTPMPARTDTTYDTSQPFEIAEDEDADHEIVELSPNVMQYRKGKEPKRARCASYFDSDIFQKAKSDGTKPDNGSKLKFVEQGGRTVLAEITQDPREDSGDGDASGEGEMEVCDTSEGS